MRAWYVLATAVFAAAGCDRVLGLDDRPAEAGPVETEVTVTGLRLVGTVPTIGELRDVRAEVHGAPNAQQPYTFSATRGAVVPSVGMVDLDANGDAEITTTYSALASGSVILEAKAGSGIATLPFDVRELLIAGLEKGPYSTNAAMNVYFGARINLGQAGELRSIGLETTVGMTTLGKFGLYTDTSGRPDTLIADLSTAQAVQSGRNLYPVPATMLPAGDYWLVAIFDRNTPVAYAINPSATYGFIAGSFADPMPATLPSWGTTTNTQLAYFLVVLAP